MQSKIEDRRQDSALLRRASRIYTVIAVLLCYFIYHFSLYTSPFMMLTPLLLLVAKRRMDGMIAEYEKPPPSTHQPVTHPRREATKLGPRQATSKERRV